MAALGQYSWIIALISIAFCFSSFGNGANDVANSYATSVAARTLSMVQVGFLSMATEFVGAVALGARVTGTIKNSIIDIKRFQGSPGTLILAMGCAEFGSAVWLMIATTLGMPVSTTQTVVGALCGVGIASGASIKWKWASGSVSQIAASWGVSPLIAGAFAAIIFGTVKYSVLERKDPFKWAMRLIPLYLAFTAAILALFIVVEAPTADSLEEFGAGKACGIILGVFAGCLVIAYVFFVPYFNRRLVKGDTRVRSYHIPLGPMLWKEDPWLYFPSHEGTIVKDYSGGAIHHRENAPSYSPADSDMAKPSPNDKPDTRDSSAIEKGTLPPPELAYVDAPPPPSAYDRFLVPTAHLAPTHPKRILAFLKFGLLRGVMMDCITHDSEAVTSAHAKAAIYDNRVEHLWTYAQVASAMMMSIAHGSNDVANAVGPWVAAYTTYKDGTVNSRANTPIWILVIAGFLLGAGFWFFGYHIIRALGNRITRISPTRGFAAELGAAITVLLASRLAIPVSTTQCLTGATMGVALMNYDLGAVNWRQVAYIFMGWILTLPAAGLVAGLLMAMALNTPHF